MLYLCIFEMVFTDVWDAHLVGFPDFQMYFCEFVFFLRVGGLMVDFFLSYNLFGKGTFFCLVFECGKHPIKYRSTFNPCISIEGASHENKNQTTPHRTVHGVRCGGPKQWRNPGARCR